MAETANAVDQSQRPAQLLDAINSRRAENARAWFISWINDGQKEFISAARMLGLGENGRPLCSKFYHGKLGDLDPTKIVLAVETLRAQLEGPSGVTAYIGFRETRCAKAIFKHASVARDSHTIGVIMGLQGVGKSEAVREYRRRTEGDGKASVECVYCRITTNLPSLINELAEMMGLIGREKGGDPARLHRQIVQRLKSRPIFLCFDEADYLNARCLDFIRSLNDEAAAGSLLIGRPRLLKTIQQNLSWVSLNDQEKERLVHDGLLAPFVDRIFFSALGGLGDDEVVGITEDTLKAQLTEEAVSKLLFYVGQNFRLLAKIIGKLRDLRVRAGKKIDKEMIEAAWLKLQRLEIGAQTT